MQQLKIEDVSDDRRERSKARAVVLAHRDRIASSPVLSRGTREEVKVAERQRWGRGLVRIYFRGVRDSVFSARPERSIPADDLRALLDVGLVERRDRDGLVCLTAAGLVARDANE